MLASFSRHRSSFSLTAAAASWGLATVISKRALEEIPPLTLLPAQLLVSVLALGALARARGLHFRWSPQIGRLGALGILNPGMAYALSLVGLTSITASLSVLLWAAEPLFILLLAWWLLGERITTQMALSSGIALIGVSLIVFEPGSSGRSTGIILTLAGVVACAVYTVISRKLMNAEPTLVVVTIQQAVALVLALVLLGVNALTHDSTLLPAASAGAWSSALVAGLLYYGVAFYLYLSGLRRLPAATAGLFLNLIPVFGVTAGYMLLGERLGGRQWIGGLVIVLAVGNIVRMQSRFATSSSAHEVSSSRS